MKPKFLFILFAIGLALSACGSTERADTAPFDEVGFVPSGFTTLFQ